MAAAADAAPENERPLADFLLLVALLLANPPNGKLDDAAGDALDVVAVDCGFGANMFAPNDVVDCLGTPNDVGAADDALAFNGELLMLLPPAPPPPPPKLNPPLGAAIENLGAVFVLPEEDEDDGFVLPNPAKGSDGAAGADGVVFVLPDDLPKRFEAPDDDAADPDVEGSDAPKDDPNMLVCLFVLMFWLAGGLL